MKLTAIEKTIGKEVYLVVTKQRHTAALKSARARKLCYETNFVRHPERARLLRAIALKHEQLLGLLLTQDILDNAK